MTKEYRINSKTVRLAVIYSLVVPTVMVFIVGWLFITLSEGKNYFNWLLKNNAYVYVLILLLSIMIPALYLLVEYYFFNRGMNIVITNGEEIIFIVNGIIKYRNSFNNIKNCRIYRETMDWEFIPASNYSFAFLSFKDGKKFIITCLLEWDLRVMLKEISYTERRSFFPSILLYKLTGLGDELGEELN